MDNSGNSLICLIKALEGERTTVELRSESAVEGKIEWVDDKMNVTLTEANLFRHDGKIEQFDRFFVKGRQIRFVHIPDHLDALELIKGQLEPGRNERKKTKFFDQTKKKSDRVAELIAKRSGKR